MGCVDAKSSAAVGCVRALCERVTEPFFASCMWLQDGFVSVSCGLICSVSTDPDYEWFFVDEDFFVLCDGLKLKVKKDGI